MYRIFSLLVIHPLCPVYPCKLSRLPVPLRVNLVGPVYGADPAADQDVLTLGGPAVGGGYALHRTLEMGALRSEPAAQSCAASSPAAPSQWSVPGKPPKPPLCSASRLRPSMQSSGVPIIHEPLFAMNSATSSSGPSNTALRPLVPSEYSRR